MPVIITNCAYNERKEEIRHRFRQIRQVCSELKFRYHSSLKPFILSLPIFKDIAAMKAQTATTVVKRFDKKYNDRK